MSKENNLTDFLTDVADAIREKKGTSEKINPQDFSEEIRGIESGGEDIGFTIEVYDPMVLSETNFKKLSISEGVTSIKTNFFGNWEFESLYIPNSLTSYGLSSVKLKRLKEIVVGDSNPVYDSRNNCNGIIKKATLYNKPQLIVGCSSTIIPDEVEEIAYACFQGSSIKTINIPALVSYITSYSFADCASLSKVIVLGNLTKIAAYAFNKNTSAKEYNFTKCEQVPTLDNVNAFGSIPSDCKIVVPDNLYDEWIAATNWSTYADRIVKASEYVEPTNE
jgi:hypothetical protein